MVMSNKTSDSKGYHLRGKENVHIELGLVALAHNLRKRATVDRRSKEPKNTNQHKNRENRIKRFSRFYVLRCFWDSPRKGPPLLAAVLLLH
uniref:Transposase DDE domain-containing protein n=1 Tax=Halalkalibacterium halodurans TaxID=86665 RepID=A0A0M0KH11_ALKHA